MYVLFFKIKMCIIAQYILISAIDSDVEHFKAITNQIYTCSIYMFAMIKAAEIECIMFFTLWNTGPGSYS